MVVVQDERGGEGGGRGSRSYCAPRSHPPIPRQTQSGPQNPASAALRLSCKDQQVDATVTTDEIHFEAIAEPEPRLAYLKSPLGTLSVGV